MYTLLSLRSPYRNCLSDGDVMHEVASWLEFQFDQIMLFPRVTKGFLARNGSPQCCIGCLAPIFGRHCASKRERPSNPETTGGRCCRPLD